MITIEQCRGARGLLAWTQKDLANASGLSKTAINNFEKGHSDIKAESLRAIRMAFETANIEFIGAQGLALRTELSKIIRGEDAIADLLEDMHKTLAYKNNEEIYINFADKNLETHLSEQKIHKHTNFLTTHKISQKVISFSKNQNILGPITEHRWIDEKYRDIGTTTFIYSDKIAHKLWNHPIIIITQSSDAAQVEKLRFEELWNTASAK